MCKYVEGDLYVKKKNLSIKSHGYWKNAIVYKNPKTRSMYSKPFKNESTKCEASRNIAIYINIYTYTRISAFGALSFFIGHPLYP